MRARPAAAEGATDPQLSELTSFRLHLLARLTDQHAESSYLREVGLKLLECRIVGVVGRHAPIGFKALCERAELEKSNASRMVASLIERGWLARHDDPVDQRSFLLSLTDAGRGLRETIYRLGVARNEQWLSVLDDAQREVFATCPARLTAQARRTTMSTHVNNTVRFDKLPFDPAKDFTPITQVSLGSVLLTAPADAPYDDLKGFVAWAKQLRVADMQASTLDAGTAYGLKPGTHDAALTEVGAGTPMGELIRRYWHPVGLSTDATDTPRQVRVLGEDLILFRDGQGRAGLVHPSCAHRGASLYFGHRRFPGDYEAQTSQGAIAAHSAENLRTSDRGIAMLRRLFRKQLDVVAAGGDPVGVERDPQAAMVGLDAGHFLL